MKRKRVIINNSSTVRRQRDPIPWKYCVLTVVCGLIFVSGFFAAARLHFSSVDYGMKNANLRTKIAELQDEKRRLLLSKERASSPNKIAKLAKDLGFSERPRSVVASAATVENASAATVSEKAVYSNASYKDGTDSGNSSNKDGRTASAAPRKAETKNTDSKDEIAALRGAER